MLDNETDSATVSGMMTDSTHHKKPAPSQLLAGFGAVTPKHKPEDWRKVREDMEVAMAEEVAAEDR
jgi:hypothetical protein